MKQFFLLLTFFIVAISYNFCYADNAEVPLNIKYPGNHGTHFEFPVPAIEPDVYYDSDAQIIIVEGTGNVSYYDVEITALSTFDVPISTRIDGTYDTIDISSLPSDDYVITINTPLNIRYEGLFTVN